MNVFYISRQILAPGHISQKKHVLNMQILCNTMTKTYKGFARVYKWGGSYVIKIRPETRIALNINRNDFVEITLRRSDDIKNSDEMTSIDDEPVQ